MKLSSAAALAVLAAFSSKVHAHNHVEENPQECVEDYDPDTDYFPSKWVPDETTDLLTVEYFNSYKIVTNKHADKSYLLYQCGTEPPADEVDKHHLVLSIPHRGGVVTTQTPQIPPMELLGLRREFKANFNNPKYVSSPCLNNLRDAGDVVDVYFEDESWGGPKTDAARAEFMAENPDVIVLAGPFGDAAADRTMAVSASQERTNVATFDWIGMYAALYNLEGQANHIIAGTKSRYECSARNAASVVADLPEEEKPTILWANYFSSGVKVGGEPAEGWSVAECPTDDHTYYCESAAHCGASIIARPEGVGFQDDYGYWYLTDEEFLELGKDAETFIFPSSNFGDIYNSKKEILDQFKSVQNENVYDTQGQGEHAWQETRLAEYDVVTQDMCAIAGTTGPGSLHVRRWFRSYFKEPIGSLGACDVDGGEIDLAYVPAQAQCTPFEVMAEPQQSDEPVDDADAVEEETSDEDVAEEKPEVEVVVDTEEPEVEVEEDSPASFRSVGLAAALAIAYPIIA
ncbi:hypothetical protein THAOC_28013 [Thalassiosira oceanica]|uniref:Leucine-binding protein domain-containing protein n=1 Tax=Thalassiosira oceanica TaxID=159749 RepID=K0RKC0_THAOC|nr:hypothetical protein THAOC_28013 [Thalassiosira oceanica]|eukprot:EJK52684.1 hypothetical protein THAOC_28013 [Thalassiosira oceanica]